MEAVAMDARFTHKSPIRDVPAADRIGDGGTSVISRQTLAAAGAVVRELPGTPPDVSSWIGVGN